MSGSDRGAAPRTRRVQLRQRVALYDGKRTVAAEVRNLSEGGAFLAMKPPLPLETGVSFWLPLEGRQVLVRGHVRWTRSLESAEGAPVGCGVEFYDPDRKLAGELGPLLERVAARGA